MKNVMSILVLFLSMSSFAKEVESNFNIDGELSILNPEIITVRDGVFSMGMAESCGIFRCKNKRFVLKNVEEKVEIPLTKKTELGYEIPWFHGREEMKKEVVSADSKLKLNFSSKIGEKTIQFVFKEYPQSCEKICTQSSSYCAGETDSFGNCDFRGEVETCSEYTTKCTPAYEACLKETTAPVKLELAITEVDTGKVAATFTSKEKTFKDSEKVKMVNCFQK